MINVMDVLKDLVRRFGVHSEVRVQPYSLNPKRMQVVLTVFRHNTTFNAAFSVSDEDETRVLDFRILDSIERIQEKVEEHERSIATRVSDRHL